MLWRLACPGRNCNRGITVQSVNLSRVRPCRVLAVLCIQLLFLLRGTNFHTLDAAGFRRQYRHSRFRGCWISHENQRRCGTPLMRGGDGSYVGTITSGKVDCNQPDKSYDVGQNVTDDRPANPTCLIRDHAPKHTKRECSTDKCECAAFVRYPMSQCEGDMPKAKEHHAESLKARHATSLLQIRATPKKLFQKSVHGTEKNGERYNNPDDIIGKKVPAYDRDQTPLKRHCPRHPMRLVDRKAKTSRCTFALKEEPERQAEAKLIDTQNSQKTSGWPHCSGQPRYQQKHRSDERDRCEYQCRPIIHCGPSSTKASVFLSLD